MQNSKKLIFILFCFTTLSSKLYAETKSEFQKKITLPKIGSAPEKKAPASNTQPFYKLTACSQRLGSLQFNTLPVKPPSRTVIVDTAIWGIDEKGYPITRIDKVRNFLFLGTADNPKIAVLKADSISTYPAKIFAYDYPDVLGVQQGNYQPAAAFKVVNDNSEYNISPVTFHNYPDMDQVYMTIDAEGVMETELPLDQVISIDLNKRTLNPNQEMQVAEEIVHQLRKGMDEYVDAMVFKARERVGLEARTQWHEPSYDLRNQDFIDFKEAFCECKDLKGFEGFEQSATDRLINKADGFGSFLIWEYIQQEDAARAKPMNSSDLNCNLS